MPNNAKHIAPEVVQRYTGFSLCVFGNRLGRYLAKRMSTNVRNWTGFLKHTQRVSLTF